MVIAMGTCGEEEDSYERANTITNSMGRRVVDNESFASSGSKK
jgi:hypothetical protein